MGIGKSGDGHAGVVDARDTWISVERTVERLGRRHLSHETDIRDSRPIAMAEPAARGMFSKQRLHRLEAGAEPVLDPGESLLVRWQPWGRGLGVNGEINSVRGNVSSASRPKAPQGVANE